MESLAERVAKELLRDDGAAVIWQAHETAAKAFREGNHRAAEILLNIADAAEEAVRAAVGNSIQARKALLGRAERGLAPCLRGYANTQGADGLRYRLPGNIVSTQHRSL
jgi:hypothetical protein